ncbi:MAG: TatD family hydrolase [Lachnospiraceae bacterium]|nr:TatD family hydrolase [Lachnospiraceae bacterium]
MIFDTHCHYDDKKYDPDRDQVIETIMKEGVVHFVNVSADRESLDGTFEILDRYPMAYGALGIHPSEIEGLDESVMDEIAEKTRGNDRIVAIGEIGLDYWEEGPDKEDQAFWFRRQLSLARELDKPVIIHSRDAVQDTFDILAECHAEEMGGVIHCFSASAEMAERYVKKGFYIGIGGVVTFKNAKTLKEVAAKTPLENIVLETDCPYLAPMPHRGERNYSGYLNLVAEAIADIKGISKEEVCETTYQNALKLYRLSD